MIEIPQHLSKQILHPTSESLKVLFDELLDPGTRWHSLSTAVMMAEFLPILGMEVDERIVNGALFHDIGKADELVRWLIHMRHLSRSAISLIRDHTQIGSHFIIDNGLTQLIDPRIAKDHHARYDGNGYPKGLSGEDIPDVVRAFSIVDAWDAIQRPSPGVKPRTMRDSAIGIASGAERGQFDPHFAAVFLRNRSIWDSPILASIRDARNTYAREYGRR